MIFNLNEQKVLSDPSGSSVFKGEKDFNDIVVNLPDNIDGHTATELNYVMHFVDSDGGYSTKVLTVDSSGGTLKATATVSTNITSKVQAFYAYVLMTDDEETVIGKTNSVIVMIHPVPDEENEIIPPADADKIIKGFEEIVQEATEALEKADNYNELKNKPSINNVTLSGNKSSNDLNLQDKLTAGENITISSDNVISAEGGGVTSYNDLTDKPILENYSPNQRETNHTLSGTISFYPFTSTTTNGKTYFRLDDVILFKCGGNATISDFNSTSFIPNGAYSCFVTNHPSFMNAKYDLFVIYNFKYPGTNGLAQLVFWVDNITNEAKSAFRVGTGTSFTGVSDWVELGSGGSQIVSGVVNANGTITFTDSDGNTFTTTGSSVIGADGFSPVATVTQTASGATVSITDSTGTTTANISNGSDYVLTNADKAEIAQMAVELLPNADTVSY